MQYREEDMQSEPKVDLCFQVIGKHVPVDHGYALYGAISRILPIFHEDEATGLKLIRGRYLGEGLLDISPSSELILRLPLSRIAHYLTLAGKRLEVGGHRLTIGVMQTRDLIPAVALYAHLVTTKNGTDQERFEAEVGNQMNAMDIRGKFTVGKRRTFSIHDKQVVGYSTLVFELTAQESIAVQESGIGGRGKMGCGFFEPWRG
jgi:CRISPR-associated protein Cas6